MSLTADETTDYEALRLKVLEGPGKRVGLAKKFNPKDGTREQYDTDKTRLRELIGKKKEQYDVRTRN